MPIYLQTRVALLGKRPPSPLHPPAVCYEVSEAPCQLRGSVLGTECLWVIPVICRQRTSGASGMKGIGGPMQGMMGITLMLLLLGSVDVESRRGVWCLALLELRGP
jgi:hypothetical protein